MKAVVLTRKQVVEASYYLHEAERSLHHVLNPACRWQDFQAYYTPEKVATLQLSQQPTPTVAEILCDVA